MKRLFTVMLYFSLLFSNKSFTQVLLEEDFRGTNVGTNLNGYNGWSPSNGSGTGTSALTSSQSLLFSGYNTSDRSLNMQGTSGSFDANGKLITSQNISSGGSIYVAFVCAFNSNFTSTTSFDFVRIGQGNSFSIPLRIYTQKQSSPAALRFGIGVGSGSSTANANYTPYSYSMYNSSFPSTSLTSSTTHLVIVKLTGVSGAQNNTGALWVYTANGGVPPTTEPAAQVTGVIAPSSTEYDNAIDRFFFRMNSGTAPSGFIGTVRVSTTWEGLFPTCLPPPITNSGSITSSGFSYTIGQGTSNGMPDSYEIEQVTGALNFTGTPSIVGVTSSPYNITALSASTQYRYRVRSKCGANYSTWSSTDTVTTIASCLVPNSLTTGILTSTTALLDWTQTAGSSSGEPSSSNGYDIEYNTTGVFTGTPTVTDISKPYSLSGLTQATKYYFKVRAKCSVVDNSLWSSTGIFTTLCNPVSVPYSTSFEGSTSLPTCWDQTILSGTTDYISVSNNSGITTLDGTNAIRYNSFTASSTHQQRVKSPVFTTVGVTNQLEVSLLFYTSNTFPSFNDRMNIDYSLDGGLNWNTVNTIYRAIPATGTTSNMQSISAILPSALNGQSSLIIGLTFYSGNGADMYVDKFEIKPSVSIQNNNSNICTTTSLLNVASKNWYRVNDGTDLVLEINSNVGLGSSQPVNNLGTVNIQYKDITSGSANVPVVGTQALLSRLFTIKPTGTFTGNVGVRLYFSDAELADYNTKTGGVTTISGLSIKKTNGIVEDCDPANNTSGTNAIITPTAVDYGSGFYLEFTTTSFSEFAALDINVVLAVELKNVQANATGNSNKVSWITASEKNNSHFIIERSANGENGWVNIGTVKGLGNTSVETNYSFNDNGPLSISYYRLRSVDNNGKEEVSKVVSVYRKIGKLNIAKVYPNPTTSLMSVDFESTAKGTISATITDLLGRVVSNQQVIATEGFNRMDLDITNLAKGIYILGLQEGKSIVSFRIVKQ
jgi:Secretion system C-terminal sorting domain